MIHTAHPLYHIGIAQFRWTTAEVGLLVGGLIILTIAILGAVAFALDVDIGGDDTGPSVPEREAVDLQGDEVVRLSDVAVEDELQSPLVKDDPLWMDGHRTAMGEWFAARRRRTKRRKLAKKGYVEWRLVDGTFPEPAFVKPRRNGSGVPEYNYDGNSYIFPEGAAVPSGRSGMRCFVHRAGEIDPINVRDPVAHSIAPDAHQEYSEMDIQTGSPGFFTNMSAGDMLFYGLVGIIVAAVGWSAMNGGLV